MVQLRVLSGKQAGASWVARRFPVRIGRAAAADFQAEEPGVWEQHAEIDFRPADGFLLKAGPQALVTLNGEAAQEAVLRNGDILDLGALKLQFWLCEPRQTGLRLREVLFWLGLAAVCASQIALLYWLPK